MNKYTENHTSNGSTEMTHQQKYRGLIKRSVFKNFRDDLFRYFDYIYTMASSYHFVTDFFRLIIFFQQCVMAFLPFNRVLWPHTTLLGRIFTIFSVISFICPTSTGPLSHFIIVFIIYCIILLLFIVFFANLYVFLKMSKVNSFFVSVITIFLNIVQPYLINMISSHIGRDGYFIIHGEYTIFHCVTLALGFIYLILLLFFQTYFISPSITFRPQVTHIMYSRFSFMYFLCYILIFMFSTLGSLLSSLQGLIISIATVIPGLCIAYVSFRQHLWADIRKMYMSEVVSILYCISTIILPILSYLDIQGNEIIILVFISFIIVLMFLFQKLSEKQKNDYLKLLNQVAEDETLVSTLSYRQIVGLLRYGFDNGHPLCHTWRLFELALDKYKNDYGIVLMYARYAAIYSEESNSLQIVINMLKRMKHGSIEMKHVIFQVRSLLQHRERGLSKSLKKMLMKIQDKTEKCRGLMRYTWECVIRGNVVELESLSTQLKGNEEEILREYNQLCLVYPNNPYVTSAFSAFLLDIMCNEKEASEKQKIYRLLRSGAWTRTERSYYFAIRHISTLPTEEQHQAMTRPEKSNVNENHSYASSVAAVGMIGDLNDGQDEVKAQKRYIESMVNSVKLPTTRYGPFLLIFSIALLIPIITVPQVIIMYNSMTKDAKSLDIIRYASLINLYMSHIAFRTFQYGMSALNFTSSVEEKWKSIYNEELSHLFSEKEDAFNLVNDQEALLDCVEFLRLMQNYFNNEVPSFATSKYFEEPLNYIFNNKMYYRNYNETNMYSNVHASLEYILTFTQGLAIQIATMTNKESILDSTGFWTIVKNAPIFFGQFDEFEYVLVNSIQNMFDAKIKNSRTIALSSMIPGLLVSLFLVIFLTVKIEKEKRLLFNSFKAIPKSAISAIVQQLNAQSGKDNQDTEQVAATSNMQEENALRILSTTVDHGFGWIGRSWKIILIMLIFVIASLCAIILMCRIPEICTQYLIEIAPLYHDISTLHNKFMTVQLLLNRIGQSCTSTEQDDYGYKFFPCDDYPDDYEENLIIAEEILTKISDSAHVLRFGSSRTRSNGVSVAGNSLVDLLGKRNSLNVSIAESDIIILEICSYDTSLEYANRMYTTMTINLAERFDYYPLSNDELNLMAIWLLDFSYMKYVVPSFEALDDEIIKNSSVYRNTDFLLPIIIVLVLMVICGIIIIPFYQAITENAQWTLRLLLFCDPNVILQSKSILKVLSNDFSGYETDETEEKSSFYESIVTHLLDGVLFMSNDLIVRSANNAVQQVIGKSPSEIIGLPLKDLLKSPVGLEASLRSFYQAVDAIMNCMRSPIIETEVDIVKEGGKKENSTLLLSLMAISATGEVQTKPVNSEGLAVLVLTMKDMTSNAMARNLLQEENAKNENLLSMILPPIIIKKLQRGERNINFSVPSATIVFLDLVAFTPWCTANKPSYVMSILNNIFSLFDSTLKKLDKMIKVKCISDMYMCAGGIFDEVNQPAEHAKQAIAFGLEAIKAVKKINEEFHESFRIRVGCNTGGPIVAGLLGMEKPIFDILGPDINLALEMQQNGVPMHVQIPQHVYELVYGDLFAIKERGDIVVKEKTYHTYIVSGYAHHNH